MTSITKQQISTTNEIMAELGFEHEKHNVSHSEGYQFVDLILYRDYKSGDRVDVSFSIKNEAEEGRKITTIEAKFNKRIDSPLWGSLEEFEEKVGTWMQECRSTN